jgi:lipopolysaccharide/colanic/teichoic acid biosynthesis glycosyltransferase
MPVVELELRPLLPIPGVVAHAPDTFYARYGKRVLDVLGSLAGILLGALPVLVAAVAMRLESRGPVFILQPRVGRGGRIFEIIKLRTMVADAEAGGVQWASVNDPRITSVGRWVRRLRIDEIPQFLNVLLGQMSLVGPRPERPELHDRIVARYPDFAKRLAVKPGITGFAQIYDGYADSIESSRRKLAYDLQYIAKLSFWLDLELIFRTIRVILTGYGSR